LVEQIYLIPAMKKIHHKMIAILTGVLSVVALSSCTTSQDYSNATQIDREGPVRTFHPSRRTQGSSARLHLDKPEHVGKTGAPRRGFHPSRRP